MRGRSKVSIDVASGMAPKLALSDTRGRASWCDSRESQRNGHICGGRAISLTNSCASSLPCLFNALSHVEGGAWSTSVDALFEVARWICVGQICVVIRSALLVRE